MDSHQFYTHLLETARANLPYANGDVREAIRAALGEAHSTLSQRQFFAALDALGGHQAVMDHAERDLTAQDAAQG